MANPNQKPTASMLLTTKIKYAPSKRQNLVLRRSLLTRLSEGLQKRRRIVLDIRSRRLRKKQR